MNPGEPIVIEKVSNGFIVKDAATMGKSSVDKKLVFTDKAALAVWLNEHFTE